MSLVTIPINRIRLDGDLIIPNSCVGLVIFSHGSGSSRFSPRNKMVAEKLREKGFATLLFDLLTEQEDEVYTARFDIDLLTERLIQASEWAQKQRRISNLPIGYFGASTGAASALMAASRMGDTIKAVVSRGGRPDLAMEMLGKVKACTLLLVGGFDNVVIELNQQAFKKLSCEKELQVIPGATHLFEEPGKLEEVAELAAEWYEKHLAKKVIDKTY